MVSASGATGAAAPGSGQRAQAGTRVLGQQAAIVDEVVQRIQRIDIAPLLRGRGGCVVHRIVFHGIFS